MDNMPLISNREESLRNMSNPYNRLEEEENEGQTEVTENSPLPSLDNDGFMEDEYTDENQAGITHFNEAVKHKDTDFSASVGTLPPSLSRHRNISRSLVPKMRSFFEKARSADPEFVPRSKVGTPTPMKNGFSSNNNHSDGTESARSSFMLVNPGENLNRSLTGSTLTLSEDSDGRLSRDESKRKPGFVNKCVTKVRSFMGKSQERE